MKAGFWGWCLLLALSGEAPADPNILTVSFTDLMAFSTHVNKTCIFHGVSESSIGIQVHGCL